MSAVAQAMSLRAAPSLVAPPVLDYSVNRLQTIIADGYGLMPAYAVQLPPDERWAVAAYVSALRLSRHAELGSLPAEDQEALRRVTP